MLAKAVEYLLLHVVETVEVAEDRRHRHAGALGDLFCRWLTLAIEDQGERGVDRVAMRLR